MKLPSVIFALAATAQADFKATPACMAGATCAGLGTTFLGTFAAKEAFRSNHEDASNQNNPAINPATINKPAVSQYSRVPGGRLVDKRCVLTVPDNVKVEQIKGGHLHLTYSDGRKESHPPCPYKDSPAEAVQKSENRKLSKYVANGWVAAEFARSQTLKNNGVSSFTGEFRVPKPPADFEFYSQVLFYWFGTENRCSAEELQANDCAKDANVVLQPVLQYGQDGTDCAGWCMRNWYVGLKGYTLKTGTVNVNPGQLMKASMVLSNGVWTVSGGPAGQPDPSTISASFVGPQDTSITVTMEAYGITSCNQFPASNSIKFEQLKITSGCVNFNECGVDPEWTDGYESYAYAFASNKVTGGTNVGVCDLTTSSTYVDNSADITEVTIAWSNCELENGGYLLNCYAPSPPPTPDFYKCPDGLYSASGEAGCFTKCPNGEYSEYGEDGC